MLLRYIYYVYSYINSFFIVVINELQVLHTIRIINNNVTWYKYSLYVTKKIRTDWDFGKHNIMYLKYVNGLHSKSLK